MLLRLRITRLERRWYFYPNEPNVFGIRVERSVKHKYGCFAGLEQLRFLRREQSGSRAFGVDIASESALKFDSFGVSFANELPVMNGTIEKVAASRTPDTIFGRVFLNA